MRDSTSNKPAMKLRDESCTGLKIRSRTFVTIAFNYRFLVIVHARSLLIIKPLIAETENKYLI